MYKHLIPIMATVTKWRGKICLAFLFRVSLIFFDQFKVPKIKFGKCFDEFMIPIALLKEFGS